jgi:hypothetical protein
MWFIGKLQQGEGFKGGQDDRKMDGAGGFVDRK